MNHSVLEVKVQKAPTLRYTQDNKTPIAEMEVNFEGLRAEDPPGTIKVLGWGNIGQELQKKILVVFSAITLTPTLLIAFFSIFIFDSALSGWFNKKISTAISQSVEVANQYLNEHPKIQMSSQKEPNFFSHRSLWN